MKKFSKIFAIIFAVAIALTIGIVAVSASSDELQVTYVLEGVDSKTETVSEIPSYTVGDYLEYEYEGWRASYRIKSVSGTTVTLDYSDARYYSVKDASGEETYVTKATLGNPETTDELLTALSDRIRTDLSSNIEGATIKLCADVMDKKSGSAGINATKYFDLNGFYYLATSESAKEGTKSAFSVGDTSFYVYSSRPGGSIFVGAPYASVTEKKDSETGEVSYDVKVKASQAYSAFSTTVGHIYLGRFGDIDGDNLSIYANMMANLTGSYKDGSYAMSFDGGYYYKWCSSYMTGMFYFRDNKDYLDGELNVSIKNATFNSEDYLFYYYHGSGAPVAGATKTFRLDIDNTVLKATNSIFSVMPYFVDRVDINLDNSYVLSGLGSTESLSIGEGCKFSGVGAKTDGLVSAKILNPKKFTFKYNKFVFTDYVYNEKLGYVTAKFDPSSFDVAVSETEIFFTSTTAKEEHTSLITWIDENGNVTQERWLNGEVPRPSKALPEGTDSYYYTYGVIEAANGDKTYVARPVAKFGLKINLTLSDDLFYNVYVPETVIEDVREVRVYNSLGEGVVLERGEKATINGVPYYRYFFNIQASKAADAFSFDMDIFTDKASGKYFTQKNEMSIPAYAAPIIYNNDYSDATHNLMNKVLAYVKAACDYFKTAGENKYYSVIGKIPSVTAPTYRAGEEIAAIPEESDVKGVLQGISVIFGSQLKYRFYFKNTDFAANEVKLSWVRNGNVSIAEITAESLKTDEYGKYYDITLRASDMRSDVKLTVNSDAFTYNLSNYIFEVNNGSDENAKALVYSLWDYSDAASKFNNEMPDVDVSIDGTPISEYKIVAATAEEIAAAEVFKSAIAKEYNIELEILSAYDGKAIVFKSVSPESIYDYKAALVGDDLVVECAYRSFFENATDAFVNDEFCNLNRDFDLKSGYEKQYFYGKILYSDFDVPKFNGTAEQFNGMSAAQIDANAGENAYFAIKRAHDVANSKGYEVYAEKDATYFMGTSKNSVTGKIETITIRTNTYWQGADFIVNDSSISRLDGSATKDVGGSSLFVVSNDHASMSVSPAFFFNSDENGKRPFYTTDTKLEAGLGYDAMLFVTNNELTQYIRFGYDTKQGRAQQELILIDAEGNIDPSTPPLFDFNNVTSVSVYRADTKPIVVDGGEGCVFTTLSSQVILHSVSATITRFLSVERSNATVKNVEHAIYNEPVYYQESNKNTGGHSYSGFFSVTRATNVTFENCVAQSRAKCKEGTYDIGASYANNVTYRNVTQSNFFKPGTTTPNTTGYWWIMGSNYCKNISYDGCTLTRFDAHAGVYNASIKNSNLCSVRLTGGGTFTLEDSKLYSTGNYAGGFIELREDYGSTWNGDLIIKNVHIATNVSASLSVIRGVWEHHEFGYDVALPNVIIDNLTFNNKVTDLCVFNITNGIQETYKYFVTETVTYDGVSQSVTKQIVDTFDAATLEALKALTDASVKHFDGTISRVITYEVKDKDGKKHQITENETVVGFDNVNPHKAPSTVIIKNMSSRNYTLTKSFADMFDKTIFLINPKDFGGDSDTPIIDVFK